MIGRSSRLALVILGVVAARADADAYFDNLKKGARYTRMGNKERALDAFKAAVKADNMQLDGYFNAGNVARHLKKCRDVLLYFRGFLYLSRGTPDDGIAKAGLRKCEKRDDMAVLTLRSDPEGMEVILDGALVGKTPLIEERFAPGTYDATLTCRCPDFEDLHRTITLSKDDPNIVDVSLTRKITYGFLKVISNPAEGVQVFVDEEPVGTTPLEPLRLETKKHFIRLKKDGYDRWIRNVVIQRDRTVNMVATLEAVAPPSSSQDSLVDESEAETKKQ